MKNGNDIAGNDIAGNDITEYDIAMERQSTVQRGLEHGQGARPFGGNSPAALAPEGPFAQGLPGSTSRASDMQPADMLISDVLSSDMLTLHGAVASRSRSGKPTASNLSATSPAVEKLPADGCSAAQCSVDGARAENDGSTAGRIDRQKTPSRRRMRLVGSSLACVTLVVVGAGFVHAWSGPGTPISAQSANYSEYTSHSGLEYRIVPLGSTLGSPMRVEVRRLDPSDWRVVDARTGQSLVVDHRPIASVQLTLNGVGTDLAWESSSNAWQAVLAPSQVNWFGSNQLVLVAKAVDGSLLARFERKVAP